MWQVYWSYICAVIISDMQRMIFFIVILSGMLCNCPNCMGWLRTMGKNSCGGGDMKKGVTWSGPPVLMCQRGGVSNKPTLGSGQWQDMGQGSFQQGSQRFPRIKFHDFFHDFPWSFHVFFHNQRDTKMTVSGISFYFSYCGLHITLSHTFSTKNETNNTNFI